MFNRQRIGFLDLRSRKAIDVLQSRSLALRAPRVAPDGRWVTFLGSDGSAFIAPFRSSQPVPETEWRRIGNERDRVADAFWSPDGSRVYWMIANDSNQATIVTRAFDPVRGEWTGSSSQV